MNEDIDPAGWRPSAVSRPCRDGTAHGLPAIPTVLGLTPDQVLGLLATAGQAPSLHNSQPWRFRVAPDVIELWADPQRRLPATDPHDHELHLACGASLFNLWLALHGHCIQPLVALQPDHDQPDLLATVRHGGRKPPTPPQRELLAAIPRRRTNRHPFSDVPITAPELAALRRAALDEGCALHVMTEKAERNELRKLAAAAHTAQLADPAFRTEYARWTAVDPSRDDGVPARTNEQRPSAHERFVKRDFTHGAGRPTAESGVPYESQPTLIVLLAPATGTAAEIRAGQALQHVLLTATVEGLAVSYLSQVIEVDQTREQLRQLIGALHPPLALLRVGRGWPVPPTPRRPAQSTLMDDYDTAVRAASRMAGPRPTSAGRSAMPTHGGHDDAEPGDNGSPRSTGDRDDRNDP